MKTTDQTIYLASKSPRRKELLRQIGIDHEVLQLRDDPGRGTDVDESPLPGEEAGAYVERVTRAKAEAALRAMQARRLPTLPVLAADTTVTVDGKILGKPADREMALAMITGLAGRSHDVLTSVAVAVNGQLHQITQRSSVSFAPMSAETIAAYCDCAEPYDKAGGYGIQGHAARFIREIAGSYSGIMGLPLHETAELLALAGLEPRFVTGVSIDRDLMPAQEKAA